MIYMYIIDEQNVSQIIARYLDETKTDTTTFYLKQAEKLVDYIPQSTQKITFFLDQNLISTLAVGLAYLLSRTDKELILFVRTKDLPEETIAFLQILEEQNVHIYSLNHVNQLNDLQTILSETNLVIDALTALPDNQADYLFAKQLVQVINRAHTQTLSLDFPFFADEETMVVATTIISFLTAKKCFTNTAFLAQFNEDDITLESLDIDQTYYQNDIIAQYIEDQPVRDILDQRKWALTDHKYDFGHTIILAGNEGTFGAALLATEAAIKTGCGVVSLYTHPKLANLVPLRIPEALSHPYTDIDNLQLDITRATSILIGPGLGVSNQSLSLLELIFAQATCPIIVDADALTLIHKQPHLLSTFSYPVIFTPHVNEFARFTGLDNQEIISHRIDVAREFAKRYNVILALKGYQTVVSDGVSSFVNTTGTSAMASAGMGDVLAGIIASLVALGYESLEATVAAVFMHGMSGESVHIEKERVQASDLLQELPFQLTRMKNQ